MMNTPQNLQPKAADGVLQVIFIGRVSQPGQSITNIEASYKFLEPHLHALWKGPTRIQRFGEQGSGLNILREEVLKAEAQISTGTIDLVMCEDISRAYRDPKEILAFCYRCVNEKTRLVCPGDNIDTSRDDWFTAALMAAMRHGMYIPDTLRRLKRTADDAFDIGGQVIFAPPGYEEVSAADALKPEIQPHHPGLRIRINVSLLPLITRIKDRILTGKYSWRQMAYFATEIGFPTGPRCKTGIWTGDMFRYWLLMPILHGERQKDRVVTEKKLSVGSKKRSVNPTPRTKEWPGLAIFTKEEHQQLIDIMSGRAHPNVVGANNGAAKFRREVARIDTTFPRQQLTCKICKKRFYDAAVESMRCCNSLVDAAEPCWCHVQVKPAVMTPMVIDWLLTMVNIVPGGRSALCNAAFTAFSSRNDHRESEQTALEKQIVGLRKRVKHLLNQIEEHGGGATVQKQLDEREAELKERESTVVGIAAIGFFYVLTLYIGLGAMVSGNLDPTDSNMAAPLLARTFGELPFALITAIAFTTVLGTVSGLILAAAGAVAHDIAGVFAHGKLDGAQQVKLAKTASVVVGLVAIGLGILFHNFNVTFLVGWAFNVAASANLPAIVMLLFWRGTTKQGMIASILAGCFGSVTWLLLTKEAFQNVYGMAGHVGYVPFSQPGLVTIPMSFLILIVVSLLTEGRASARGFEVQPMPATYGQN